MKKMTTLLAATVLSATGTAHAFDNNRSGLQIGIGLGMGQTVVETNTPTGFSTENANELTGTVSLGYGLSNQVSIYLGGIGTKVSGQSEDAIATVVGLGGTLYFSAKPSSLYITGLYGLGSIGGTDAERGADNSAAAWMVGAGYQFSKHLQMQVSYTSSGTLAEDQNSIHDFQAAFATLNFVFN